MKKTDLSHDRQHYTEPVPGYPDVFSLTPPPFDGEIDTKEAWNSLWAAQEALIRMKSLMEKIPNINLITRTLDRREAVMSSQIEGTRTDVEGLLEYEATQDEASAQPDARSTFDYVRALHLGLGLVAKEGRVSIQTVKAIHQILMENNHLCKDSPGEFRNTQNWIGSLKIQDALFVPPNPEKIMASMEDLELFMNNEDGHEKSLFYHVILRSAIAHAQFETINPFGDGNGRVGRLLTPLIFKLGEYPPLCLDSQLHKRQQDYFNLILGVQLKSEWGPWISFYADCCAQACQELMDTAEKIIELKSEFEKKVIHYRSDSAVHNIVEMLAAQPVLTIKNVCENLGCSFQTANNSMAELEKLGIVVSNEYKRNRVFTAKKMIDILNSKPEDRGLNRRPRR